MGSRMACGGAALCLAAICFAAAPACADGPRGGASATPDPARIEEAKRHMKAGAAFYNDPSGHKCEEALREFRKAYDLSGSLNALKGMAVCNLELERDGDSIELYSAYLAGKKGTLDPAEQAQVEADLNALRAAVATVTLSAGSEGVRVTDVRTPAKGYPIRNTYTLPASGRRVGIHPGQHVLTASVEGMPDQTWRVEILNGGAYSHTFVFAAAPAVVEAPPGVQATVRPVPASVYASAGVTAALTVPWAILMARARSKNQDYARVNGKASAVTLTALRDDVKAANLLADVFLGATLASLTVTAVLFFTRPSKPATGSFTIGPAVGVSSGGAVASGWF